MPADDGRAGPSCDIVVERGDDLPVDAILDVLRAGYARPFGRDWFEWKHRTGPWGPSTVWVARLESRLVGVVFGLPWRLVIGGAPVLASRLVDGATVPGVVRRGMFRRVVRAEIDRATPGVVIATATPPAQAAHVKNGATALEPIRFAIGPNRPRRAEVIDLDVPSAVTGGLALTIPRPGRAAVATDWDPAALAWRLDPRSGYDYRCARLADVGDDHVVIYRIVTSHRVRTLVVAYSAGPVDMTQRLVSSLAWRHRCALVHRAEGPGTTAPSRRVAVARGRSLLCVWDHRTALDVESSAPAAPDPTQRANWALHGLDLEGVI